MIRTAILATIIVNCAPPEPDAAVLTPCDVQEDCDKANLDACIDHVCQDYVPVECDSQDDCECNEHCGDTRTCAPTCSEDVECAAVQAWTCGDLQGYCVIPCERDTECPDGQTCGPDGACWFAP